jgi:hypothetical protein
VSFSLTKGAVEGTLELPMSWHMSAAGRGVEVTSHEPWAWAVDESWPPGGMPSGHTAIVVDHDTLAASIDDTIAQVRYFDQEPVEVTEQALALPSGHDATLAVFSFDTVVSTKLFVVTSTGLLTAHCEGDTSTCSEVLGSLRLAE